MNPTGRDKALQYLQAIKASGSALLSRETIIDGAALIIEAEGTNPHTAYQQAKQIYREVFEGCNSL